MQRVRAKFARPLHHLLHRLGELGSIRCAHKEHLQSLATQADLIEEFLGVFDSAFCVVITFQVMTSALLSAGDEDGVNAALKSLEQV